MASKKDLQAGDKLLKEEVKLARYEFEDAHEHTHEAWLAEKAAKEKFQALTAASAVVRERLGDDAATDIFRGSPEPAGGASGYSQSKKAVGPAEG